MKKKTVAVLMAAVMTMGMMSAVRVQAGVEDKTLMQNIRHMAIWMRMANTQDLILNWHRLYVTWKAGPWKRNLSTGIPRIWN